MFVDKPSFDSNVLLYLLSKDSAKAEKAQSLLIFGGTISVQVLNEFATVARRKTEHAWPVIHHILASIRSACTVVPLTVEIHDEGLWIAERYGFSVFDTLIIAAAISSGCNTLYSEDMQDKQVIGTVTISNPFKAN